MWLRTRFTQVKQHARLTPHRAPWSGHTIGMDTWFPVKNSGNEHPFIIIVDRFSRLIVSGAVMDNSCKSALDFLAHRWMAVFGRPARLITDNGSNFCGEEVEAFMGVWNITHVCNPVNCPFQGGIFERSVGMLKTAVEAIMKADSTLVWEDAVSLAVTGRNLSPLLECGLSPLTIMTGRHNVLNFSIDRDFVEEDRASIHVPKQEKNLQSIIIARAAAIEYESRDVIMKCLSRNLRAHVHYNFKKDEPVQVWKKTQWMGGYRFLAAIHHNGIVECGSILQKIPLAHIRPTPSTLIQLDSNDNTVPQGAFPSIDLVPISPSSQSESIISECHTIPKRRFHTRR